MTRAIILDLDGTLYDSTRAISAANREALRRCRQAGILLIVATARPLRTIKQSLPAELDDAYLALCNGAWVMRHGHITARRELAADTVTRIVAAVQALGYAPAIEANDCFYTDGERDPRFVGAYQPLAAYPHSAACKVLAYAARGIDSRAVEQALASDVSHVITDKGTLLQVSAAGCSKLSAGAAILAAEGIALAHTAAFGDDTNDIPVFEAVGCGIAMANAAPELLRAARYVTASNDEDGVARGIERYVLGGRV